MKYKRSLFLFTRDLRLDDNTGLLAALKQSDEVLPCFILNPAQIKKNDYFSKNAFQFMVDSLKELDAMLKKRGGRLYLFAGEPAKIIRQLIQEQKIEALFMSRDYTPFATKRAAKLQQLCKEHGVASQHFDDLLLAPPEVVLKQDGSPYRVFTPFLRAARQHTVAAPKRNTHSNYMQRNLSRTVALPTIKSRNTACQPGGRSKGLAIIKKLSNFSQYDTERDIPGRAGTTRLSPHHKFGTVSIREVYHAITAKLTPFHTLITQLYWRDFFTHISHHYPHVFDSAFNQKYAKIPWSKSKSNFNRWCTGSTGFPIVDAGMRELNSTGYMHNRVRMIVASFLVKDLHIDWRWGEKYFAQQLVDYDPAVNNGNWQWAASTGCDAQPYFRVFNPWRQQERFDPECSYIKHWVPELAHLSPKEIHNLERENKAPQYPAPMVEHKTAAAAAVQLFKKQR